MDLFNQDRLTNLLPFDGLVIYHGKMMSDQKAQEYFETLKDTIEWQHDEANIFGKHFITKRKVAWYGKNDYLYAYSNTTKQALPWTKQLLDIKKQVEKICEETFNSCLLNLYHSGEEGMSWHSDSEASLKKHGTIASVSLGVDRKFSFKHKQTKETISVLLEKGSLLLMKDTTQTNWLHCLPKSKRIKKPRINLTFRNFVG